MHLWYLRLSSPSLPLPPPPSIRQLRSLFLFLQGIPAQAALMLCHVAMDTHRFSENTVGSLLIHHPTQDMPQTAFPLLSTLAVSSCFPQDLCFLQAPASAHHTHAHIISLEGTEPRTGQAPISPSHISLSVFLSAGFFACGPGPGDSWSPEA